MGNQLWELGPNYMTSTNWKEGRNIQDIHLQDHTGSEEKEAILQETKKHHEVNFNLTQTSISNTTDNVITSCLNYTNNLNKAKRILLKVIKFLVIRIKGAKMKEVLASGETQDDQDEKETETETESQYVWAQYQRKYYVGQIVKDLKALPEKLQANLYKAKPGIYVPIHFLRDDLFSLVEKTKVEPYGEHEEVDERRSRHDKVGNNIAQQELSNQRSNAQNSSQTTDNDTKSKVAENRMKVEKMGVLLSTIFNEFSPNLEPNAIDMERMLNIMVINDQLIHFKDEFNKLRLGIPIGKNSKLFKLNPFFAQKTKQSR